MNKDQDPQTSHWQFQYYIDAEHRPNMLPTPNADIIEVEFQHFLANKKNQRIRKIAGTIAAVCLIGIVAYGNISNADTESTSSTYTPHTESTRTSFPQALPPLDNNVIYIATPTVIKTPASTPGPTPFLDHLG